MKWSFGIITDGSEPDRVHRICNSIDGLIGLSARDTEVIIVGGDINFSRRKCIQFDETEKKAWISRKKNLIAQNAKHDNLCLVHDYVQLDPYWYLGFQKFGYDWLTCTNRIHNFDGTRFRDWCVIGNDSWTEFDDGEQPPFPEPGRLLAYDSPPMPRWQYYSGAYFCTKKSVLLEVPIDENRCWSQGEDVLWCRHLFFKYGAGVFSFNPYSTTKFIKQKPTVPWEGLPELWVQSKL